MWSRLGVDERGIIASHIARIAVVLTLVGIVAVEGGTILWARLKAQDAAEAGAIAAADSFLNNHDARLATDAAAETVVRKDPEAELIVPLEIDRDGNVRVTVEKRAETFLTSRIGFLESMSVIRTTAEGSPVQPEF